MSDRELFSHSSDEESAHRGSCESPMSYREYVSASKRRWPSERFRVVLQTSCSSEEDNSPRMIAKQFTLHPIATSNHSRRRKRVP